MIIIVVKSHLNRFIQLEEFITKTFQVEFMVPRNLLKECSMATLLNDLSAIEIFCHLHSV